MLEDEDTGRLIAFEVKSARESSPRFFDGIRAFKQRYPDQFHHGVVLHCGDHPLRHADDLWSLPFSALWTIGERVAAPDEEPSDPLERALSDLRSRVALGRKTAETRKARLERVSNSAADSFRSFVVKVANLASTLEQIGYPTIPEPIQMSEVTDDGGEDSRIRTFLQTYSVTNENQQLVLRLQGSAVLQANGAIIWTFHGGDSHGRVIFNLSTSADWDQADLDVRLDSLLAAGTETLGPFLDSYEGRPTQQRD